MSFILSNLSPLIYAGTFLAGLFIHSPLQKKTNSQIQDVLTKDYQSLKILYDRQLEENARLNETIKNQYELLAESRARVATYENFMQVKSLQTDQLLKQFPAVINVLAKRLDIEIPELSQLAHEAAASQVKSNGNTTA